MWRWHTVVGRTAIGVDPRQTKEKKARRDDLPLGRYSATGRLKRKMVPPAGLGSTASLPP